MLAYDYPLLGLFWTMLWVFLWVAWLFILFRVVIDIFRSHDMGGWGKALWVLFVIVVPFLGVFVYLIARGRQMTDATSRTPRTGTRPSVHMSRTRRARRPRALPRSCPSSPTSRPRVSSPTPSSTSRRPNCWGERASLRASEPSSTVFGSLVHDPRTGPVARRQGAPIERASLRASEPSSTVFGSLVHDPRTGPVARRQGAPMSERVFERANHQARSSAHWCTIPERDPSHVDRVHR